MVVWLEYLPSVFRIKYGNCQLLVWICTYGYASIRQVFQENVSLTACSNQYFKHQNCSKKQAKIHVLYIWFHVKLITVWSKYVWVFALFSSSVRYWILSCSKSHIFWHDTYFDMMHILTWQVYWHDTYFDMTSILTCACCRCWSDRAMMLPVISGVWASFSTQCWQGKTLFNLLVRSVNHK